MTSRILVGLASVLVASSLAAANELDLTILDDGVPPRLEAGARVDVPLRLRNDGTTPWSPAAGFYVAAHWRDASGVVVQWDGARTALPGVVEPQEEVALAAVLEAPRAPGHYLLQWDLVQEGVRWLSELDPTPPPAVPVTVQVGYAFSVVGGSRPLWLRPGGEVTRSLVVRNDGSVPWPGGRSFALSYHWFRRDGTLVEWDGARTTIERPLEPGATEAVEARVHAPDRPGLYRLQWDLVEENVTWFSARDPSPEPKRLVIVLAPLGSLPAGLVICALVAGAVALIVLRRGRPAWVLDWVAVADVVWCAASVVTLQEAMLAGAGQVQPWTGSLLTWAGAAALALMLLLLSPRWRAWACWAAVAAVSVVILADTVYARFFGDVLSLAVVGAAGQLGQVRASVFSLLHLGDLWLGLNLLAGLPLVLAARRAPRRPRRAFRVGAVVVLTGLVLGGVIAGARVATLDDGVLHQVFRNIYLARDVGVLDYHVLDLAREARRRFARTELTPAELGRTVDWFATRAPLRRGTGPAFGAAAGNNILMIQVESLQGFVLGLEVDGQEVTPFLNRWVRGSLLFTDVTDQTAAGRSSDAELLTQTSLLPPPHQVASFRYPTNRFTGVAEVLRERGYATLSAIPFTGSFWNRRLTHRAFGYATSLFDRDFAPGETIGWGLDDRAFFAQVMPRLSGLSRPFCAWLITLSLHHPFAGFPDRLKVLDLGEREGTPFGNYVHTMHFFDRAFESLVEDLTRHGLADHTVLVLWGDHDAGLEWDRKLAEMTGQPFDSAGWYLSQRVPLIIRVPRRPDLSGVRDLAAGQQDVAPTVLALLGIDPAPYAFLGRNLLGAPGGGPVLGEYGCWQDGDRLYLRRGPRLSDGECYRREGLEPLPAAACADGFADAVDQAAISRLVLEHDAQEQLHTELKRRLQGAP